MTETATKTLIAISDADGYVLIDEATETAVVVGGCPDDYPEATVADAAFRIAMREEPSRWPLDVATLDLDKLCAAIKAGDPRVLDAYDEIRGDLPTFGGEAPPTGTECVWSWDDTRLLVGTCVDDLRTVAREEWLS